MPLDRTCLRFLWPECMAYDRYNWSVLINLPKPQALLVRNEYRQRRQFTGGIFHRLVVQFIDCKKVLGFDKQVLVRNFSIVDIRIGNTLVLLKNQSGVFVPTGLPCLVFKGLKY